jgi:methylenetetrahydrofolate dehydrogenase (NADP+)/methenyltetrahydrofolate cyclohydrolase
MKNKFLTKGKGIFMNNNCINNININNINNNNTIKNLSKNLKDKIIDCDGLSKMMENDFKKKIPLLMKKFNIENKPKLKIISVAENFDNKIYIENKIKACKLLGIDYEHKSFSENIKIDTIKKEIDLSNMDNKISGVILQLPLSEELNSYGTELLNQVSIEKDVDGLNENTLKNIIKFNQKELDEILFSPTALGVMTIIKLCLFNENNVETFRQNQNHWKFFSLNEKILNLQGKNICVLGQGKTSGLPISLLMKRTNGNLKICDSKTSKEIFEENLRISDIVISAVGKINLVQRENLKENCLVIDVGINLIPNQTKRKICGDVDFFDCIEKVKYISKVPGGAGKITVIMLLRNVIKAWLNQNNINGKDADSLIVE